MFDDSHYQKRKLLDKKAKKILKKYLPSYQKFDLLVKPISTNPRLYLVPKRDLSDENFLKEPLTRLKRGTLKNSTENVKNKCLCCINGYSLQYPYIPAKKTLVQQR